VFLEINRQGNTLMPSDNFIPDDIKFDVLWDAIQIGDADAKGVAIESIMPKMVAAIQRRFGSSRHVDAEEATQSALRTIERRKWEMGRVPRNWSDLVGLLVTFAYNKARTQLKKRSPELLDEESTFELQEADHNPERIAIQAELLKQVRDAVQSLTESLDEVDSLILRAKYDSMSLREIVAMLEDNGHFRTEDSVRMRWKRKIKPIIRGMLEEAMNE